MFFQDSNSQLGETFPPNKGHSVIKLGEWGVQRDVPGTTWTETRDAARQHRTAFHDGDVSGPKAHSAELGNLLLVLIL